MHSMQYFVISLNLKSYPVTHILVTCIFSFVSFIIFPGMTLMQPKNRLLECMKEQSVVLNSASLLVSLKPVLFIQRQYMYMYINVHCLPLFLSGFLLYFKIKSGSRQPTPYMLDFVLHCSFHWFMFHKQPTPYVLDFVLVFIDLCFTSSPAPICLILCQFINLLFMITDLIITGSWDKSIKLWDPRQKQCTGTYAQPEMVSSLFLNSSITLKFIIFLI